jgi:hypothetical protein
MPTKRRVDEKTGRNLVADRTKSAAIGLPAREIDLRGVLRNDNPPAGGPRQGGSRQGSQHLLAGHRRSRQKPVDREFARPRLTKLADHQRSAGRHPFD